MGTLTALLSLSCVYISWRAIARSLTAIIHGATVAVYAVLGLGRALRLMWWPPGSLTYSGSPTWWDVVWRLLTLRPLLRLFAPGSFMRAYAVLVVPAAAVAAVAGASLAARSPLAVAALRGLRRHSRELLGVAACLVAAALADDAVRRHLLCGRPFPAAARGSTAAWLGFTGVAMAAGPESRGGFSGDQVSAWMRVLHLLSTALTAGAGGGTLLAHRAGAAAATAAGAPEGPRHDAFGDELADRAAFLGYGCLLCLIASASACSLAGSDLMWRAAGGLLMLLDAALRVRPLLRGGAAAARWVVGRPGVRATLQAGRRLDDALTDLVLKLLRQTLRAASLMRGAVSQQLWPLVQDMGRVMHQCTVAPLVAALRALAWAARAGATAAYRGVVLPAARAALALGRASRDAAIAAYTSVLLPLLRTLWSLLCWLIVQLVQLALRLRPLASRGGGLLRGYVAPVVWPCGAVAGVLWFGRQAAAQRALLPFGAAAYASALIVALMAGKAMRKSRHAALSRAGAFLESLAAAAYLHLDLGAGTLAARAASALLHVAYFVSAICLRTGRVVLALVAGPLFGLLAAALTAVAWVVRKVLKVVVPWVAALCEALRDCARAVWGNPELSLAAAAAAVALAYGAHAAGLPGAAARGMAWLAATAASGALRLLLLLGLPLMRLLGVLASRATRLLGLSADASARAAAGTSAALAAWGVRAAADVSSVFASRGFGGAFVGLNVAHALLLRGWAVPALMRQGAAGRAAVLPVVSFTARSTGKVALGPMYVAAAAAFLLGGEAAGGVASRLASLTAPTLWLAYLAAMYLEAGRRVLLSHDSSRDSEFARALRGVRDASAAAAGPHDAEPMASPAAAPPPPRTRPPTASWASPADASAAVAPPAAPPPLDPVELRIVAELRAQGPPGHVFPADSCAVCMEELPSPTPEGPGEQQRQQQQQRAGGYEHAHGRGEEHGANHGSSAGATAVAAAIDGVQALRCGHVFHTGCILAWLKRNPRCPVCREPVVGRSRHSNMLF